MSQKKPRIITLITLSVLLILGGVWAFIPPTVTEAGKDFSQEENGSLLGKSVLINLSTGQLLLQNNGKTVDTIQIVSQGRPGSYYETIGGAYVADYKEPLHFSSIGHVYMPYSVHVFGNYFIHGIPYYPNGEKVSSEYSGGCIRLEDIDAKKVYDFVSSTTPVIITKGTFEDFTPTQIGTTTLTSISMTHLMVAMISLEFLIQDAVIADIDDEGVTTRRALLNRLLIQNDESVSAFFARELGEKKFLSTMNTKAQTLGLTNTTFTGIHEPARTNEEDYGRFMNYILTYKSYLITDVKR